MTRFLTLSEGHVTELPLPEGQASEHHRPAHVFERQSVMAINAALATGRPLLVRGEPGLGKSQLARAAAKELGWRYRAHAVDASTEPRDLLYTIDLVARLAEAQLVGAIKGDRSAVSIERFVRPGALWWAFDWDGAARQANASGAPAEDAASESEEGVVLLIDEIDKADSAIPNALLDALGHRSFEVPGCGTVAMSAGARPLVLITTNEERALPDAFLRRCLVLHLSLPDNDQEVEKVMMARGKAHFPACEPEILTRAAELIAERRPRSRQSRLPPPGVAEYIDLVDAVLGQGAQGVDALALLEKISTFVLDKHAPPTPSGSERHE